MRKKISILFLSLALSSLFITAQRNPNNSLNGNRLKFTPNKGQVADMNGKPCPDVLYKGECAAADIYLRKSGISYVYSNMAEVMHNVHEKVEGLIKAGSVTEADEHIKQDELMQNEKIKVHRIDMDFAGCLPAEDLTNEDDNNITTINEDEVDGYQNFYYAHCPQGITGVKQYNKVTYKNIYNGIDVSCSGGKENGLKYDLVVQPYADPHQIKLHWKGTERIHINRESHLVITTSVNEFTESIPKVYQIINGEIIDIKAKYTLSFGEGRGEAFVTFKLGTYNPAFPLVIDPWATYFGGNGIDFGMDLDTDPTGNLLLVGTTKSVNLPVLPGGYTQTFGGGMDDAFVVKFNSSGVRLWATFYGGNGSDNATGITTDISGNVLISGATQSANFPISMGGGLLGLVDAFIVKFNSSGTRLWATFYGGSGIDVGAGITTDNAGNTYFTGRTQSSNFPITVGAFQTILKGSQDAFIVKLGPLGNLLWSTFLGGVNNDQGLGVTSDIGGNLFVSGITYSFDFPVLTLAGGYSQAYGGTDAFIAKFNNTGMRLWSTFYGGTLLDYGLGIATDYAGNVIMTGYTWSANFPVGQIGANVVFQSTFGGNYDAYLVKFDPSGIRQWATYYGNSGIDQGNKIAIDGNNNIYLLMEEEDPVTPTLTADACSYQPSYKGLEDQFILKFAPDGRKICATYLGGTGEDDIEPGGGISIYGNSLYIAGSTDGGYPVTAGVFQTTYAGPFLQFSYGGGDAFLAQICTNICEGIVLSLDYTASTISACSNAPVTFTPSVSNSCDTTGYKYHWTFTGGNPASSDSAKPTVAFTGVGTHDVKLVLTTLCKKDSVTKTNYITTNSCACLLTANTTTTPANCGNSNGTASVNQSGGGGPYTYLWNNGQTSQSATGLAVGNYTVTVTDAGSCTATAVASITSPPPLIGQFTKGNANCVQCGCKEWLIVNATGGTSPYTYTWPDGYASRYKNQLCPGSYSINIKDKNGCSINVNLTAP